MACLAVMLMQLHGVPVYGEPLMSLFTHSYTHGLQSWNNAHANTHAYRTGMPIQEPVFNGSDECRHTDTLRNFTGKSRWQIKEDAYRDEPFRTFENLPKDVFLKTNYPCSCVKEWPLLFPVHIRIPQIIVGFFFPGSCELHAVDRESSFTEERNPFKNTLLLFSAVRRCK